MQRSGPASALLASHHRSCRKAMSFHQEAARFLAGALLHHVGGAKVPAAGTATEHAFVLPLDRARRGGRRSGH